MGLQIVRSATSAGANYQEARHAESRADFVHKIGVAAKELGETLYWLRLLDKLGLLPTGSGLPREADELIAILVASARTARSR
jgi:four helix bundle protein